MECCRESFHQSNRHGSEERELQKQAKTWGTNYKIVKTLISHTWIWLGLSETDNDWCRGSLGTIIAAHPNAKRKPFPYYEELEILISNSTADGIGMRTAAMAEWDAMQEDEDIGESAREALVDEDPGMDVVEEDIHEAPTHSRALVRRVNPLLQLKSADKEEEEGSG
ncbi:hypothetical protein AMTRI_Chr06g199860 [Amborella trichopoda]|uniref:Uncharacterized protein n=1 Tax=Amborella trichopoda TaxID=13333 RepID=W1PUM9_AMBTC|nr:hypothetical protein AMTR_s00049p00160850 [Amborella trichopoda]